MRSEAAATTSATAAAITASAVTPPTVAPTIVTACADDLHTRWSRSSSALRQRTRPRPRRAAYHPTVPLALVRHSPPLPNPS